MAHDDKLVHKCARITFGGEEPEDLLLRRLADLLCVSSTPTLGLRSCLAGLAAGVLHDLPSDVAQLRNLVAGTGVFHLHHGTVGETIIQLDADALVQRAKQATGTGFLSEELPAPVGYVDGVHPLRPGQRDCAHWVKFAECKFGRGCVFNHPGLPSTHQTITSSSGRDSTGHAPTGLQATRPAALNTHSNSSSLNYSTPTAHLSDTPRSVSFSAAMTGRVQHTAAASTSTATPPAGAVGEPHVPSTAAPAASLDSSSSTHVARAAQAAAIAHPGAAAVCPMFLMRGFCLSGPRCTYSHPARGSLAATPDLSRSASPELIATPPAATAAHTAAAAPLPAAAPSTTGIGSDVQQSSAGLAGMLAQAAANAGSSSQQLSQPPPLHHQQQQQQPEPLTWQQQALQTEAVLQQQQQQQQQAEPLTWQQQQLELLAWQPQQLEQPPEPQPPPVHLTRQQQQQRRLEQSMGHPDEQQQLLELSAGQLHELEQAYEPQQSLTWQQQQQQGLQEPLPWQQRQQGVEEFLPWQQQQQQQEDVEQQIRDSHHRAKQVRIQRKHHTQQFTLYPITGHTPEGLPHRPGAPNCPFYMHIGTCKFGEQCVYHHPDYPAQPVRFVRDGFAAGRWFKNKPVPYSHIIMHLSRIWEYDSCPEAQLKTWMARHLISAANPNCKMWDKSAAQPIVEDDAEESLMQHEAGSPLGRYSCDLSKAGEFLKTMWLEQPDEAAATSPMPYSQKLRSLFSTDPYFQVEDGPHNSSHHYVKLDVAKLVETLNW